MRCLTLSTAVLLIEIVAATIDVKAEEPYQVEWTAQLGSNGDDYCRSVAVDLTGAVYVAGYTSIQGTPPATRRSNFDAWIAKLDSQGSLLWKKPIESSEWEFGWAVAVDASGGALVAGRTEGNLAGENQGETDAWLAKFDSSGAQLWIQQLGTTGPDSIRSVAVDAQGAVYVTGRTLGNLAGPNSGWYDAWVAKFDPSGAVVWKTQFGSKAIDCSNSIAVDMAGTSYVTGWTNGDLGGRNFGEDDVWLAKLDSAGTLLWKTQLGSSGEEDSTSIAVDSGGAVYVTGYTEGDLAGTPQGRWDAWLARFDSRGELVWKTQLGTRNEERSEAVAIDSAGAVYVGGRTAGDLAGASKKGWDAWLAKFDSTGAELWRTQLGLDASDMGYSIAVDSADAIYVAGETTGDLGRPNQGGKDWFVMKLIPAP